MTQIGELKRSVGLSGAIMMGLGSIVGTGVFVSLGLAAGVAGSSMVLALLLAGIVAICNGLSTAQLAAAHPVSGGTYEYGYRYVGSWAGYLAGWLFVCAKSASAATAAIGAGGYLLRLLGIDALGAWQVGLVFLVMSVAIAAWGIKRSNVANSLIVSVTLVALAIYIVAVGRGFDLYNLLPLFRSSEHATSGLAPSFFEATALLFVAYTGYGRVATLGEEIVDPARNIPRAVIATLAVSFALYLLVAVVSLGAVGAVQFHAGTVGGSAPLEVIARQIGSPLVAAVVALGAVTAMVGVLLNLVLGVSRVVFAMGKRGDLPGACARVESGSGTPLVAVLVTGGVMAALLLLKDIRVTWSFSALTVLLYYSITNLSALRLPRERRLYPRVLAWIGLGGCLSLGFCVELAALQLGAVVISFGVIWRLTYRRFATASG